MSAIIVPDECSNCIHHLENSESCALARTETYKEYNFATNLTTTKTKTYLVKFVELNPKFRCGYKEVA